MAAETKRPSDRPLPGSTGLPLIGETLSFLKDPFRFLDERTARHGAVFKSSLLGRKTAVITSPDACHRFIDPDVCQRHGAMPGQVFEVFAGESLPSMDGERHLARKKMVLAGFTRSALESYLPAVQSAIEQALDDWARRDRFAWLPELKRLAFEVICRTVVGLNDSAVIDSLITDYMAVVKGLTALPIKLPIATYGKAMRARDRALDVLAQAVRAHREEPTDDGLGRILAFETDDGQQIADDEAVRELHHVILAGYIIFAELVATALQLDSHPDVQTALRDEIDQLAPDGRLEAVQLAKMPLLNRVVMEVKRLTPVVPGIFAVARRDFEFKGCTVPAGWMVVWAMGGTLRDGSVFEDPERFDPARFGPDRAEHERHPHAFVPQGAGQQTGHQCPGIGFATLFMQAFTTLLLRGYRWTLPEQDSSYDGQIPPEPRDGLVAKLQAR